MTFAHRTFVRAVVIGTALAGVLMPSGLGAQVPGTWARSATSSPGYETGGNPTVKHGAEGGGYIRSTGTATSAFAHLRTEMPPGSFLGKRVRLSGFLKTEAVSGWASLSIRVEGPGGVWLARDGMESRFVKGTTDWGKHALVVDIPANAVNVVLAASLVGTGQVWVDGVTLEVVGPDVPVTDAPGRWTAGSSEVGSHEAGGDPTVRHGSPGAGFIRSKTSATKETGSFSTWVVPTPYLDRRVRLSAWVRTENVVKSAALYLAAGGANNATLGFAGTTDRPIKGTTDWKRYELVIDVPAHTVMVSYGAYVDGPGQAWVDGVALEVVGPEVAPTPPSAWFPIGSNPEDYDMGGNPNVAHGAEGGGYIHSTADAPKSFGGYASLSPVGSFLGKRVRLSGYVRTEEVQSWAGLWMRVDGPNNQTLSFDNMSSRPIVGTTGWKKYDVVLDVPVSAIGIIYGLIVSGKGKAWFDGVTMEPIGPEVPVTQMKNPYTEYYAGNYAEAAKVFPERIARTPTSYSLRLFHYLSLVRSGQANVAGIFINDSAEDSDEKWAGPVLRFFAGKLSEEEVLKAAVHPDPTIDTQQKCEAYYYLAMAYLLNLGTVKGDGATKALKGREYLEKCVATGVTTFVEYRAAQAELQRMKK